jgi:hypothetical protein
MDIRDFGFGKGMQRQLRRRSTGAVYDLVENAIGPGQVLSGDALAVRALSVGGLVRQVGPGDDIQAAIDTVSRAGGGTVQMQSGIYVTHRDLYVRSGVKLAGVGPDTAIDFDGTGYGLRGAGTLLSSAGTVSLTDGSTTVTGSSTAFTSAMSGKTLMVGGVSYSISSVTSSTELEIAYPYYGPNQAGASYVIFDPVSNIKLDRFTIQNTTGLGFDAKYVAGEFVMDYLNVYDCGKALSVDRCEFPILNVIVLGCTGGDAIKISNTSGLTIESSFVAATSAGNALTLESVNNSAIHNAEFSDSSGDGISITSCQNIGFENLSVSRNTGQGIEVVSGSRELQFNQVNTEGNGSDGIKLTATADRIVIGQCNFNTNGGYGINIAAATCDDNVLIGNTFTGNVSGRVSDSGTGTIARGNTGVTDFG